MEHLHMAIEGFGAKHEDLVKNPRFSLMSRVNPRFVFKPDKFVGFRCSGYIYIYIQVNVLATCFNSMRPARIVPMFLEHKEYTKHVDRTDCPELRQTCLLDVP